MIKREYLRECDWILLATALGLSAIGVAFVWSATYEYVPTGKSYARGWAQVQARWLVVAMVTLLITWFFDYLWFRRQAYLFYAVCLLLLGWVMAFGVRRGGATRWISVGNYLLQPAELMKVAVILALARYLAFQRHVRQLGGLVWPFVLVLLPMVMIVRQPDLGTALVFLPVMFAMLYAAGAQSKHLALALGAGAAAAPLMWFIVMSDFQKARILSFLFPDADRYGAGFHGLQSLIAIGSGGLTGKGFAQGSQHLLDLLPAAHTDFIFAVIAEEWGFLGSLFVLALYFIMFWRTLRIAARTREPFGRLVVVGALAIFAFQTCVNIGMTMRLCPITGITLPFVSYGGSSLLSSYVLLGLIINIGMRRKAVVAPDDFA